MIDVYAKAGNIGKAEAWFDKMVASGVDVAISNYNTVINACAKGGNAQRAEQWLTKMAASGFTPNVKSYTATIDAYAKVGDAKKATTIFNAMKAQGLKPTEVTYASLARAYLKYGDYQKVEEIAGMLREDGYAMNEYILNVLLSSYAHSQPRQSKRAEEVFREAVAKGIPMDGFIMSSLEWAVGRERTDSLLRELSIQRPKKGSGPARRQ